MRLGRGSLEQVPAAPIYASGFKALDEELARLRRRIARGRERATDRADLEATETALAELRALYRADLRILLELGDDAEPLDVALVHAEELLADGLTLRTIPMPTREALRRDREADWSVVLYGLADSGTHPVTT